MTRRRVRAVAPPPNVKADFTWNDAMPLGEFVTGFMEKVLPHGEAGTLRLTGNVHGQEIEISLRMEIVGVKGQTS